MVCVLYYTPDLLLIRRFPFPRYASPSVSLRLSIVFGGIGISTDCPSATAFALTLGPDLPWVDEPSPGNLGHSTASFLTSLSLLIPAFSLVSCPPSLTVRLRPLYDAPLPIYTFKLNPIASVSDFSPVTSSAHYHLTSELLRTL